MCYNSNSVSIPAQGLIWPENGILDLVDLAERVEAIVPHVSPLRGDRVVKVDPSDPVAVSKALAANADRHAALKQRRLGANPAAPGIHPLAVVRINELERYLKHRYGRFLPDDDAGVEDLVILLNHVAKNRHEPRARMFDTIRYFAPWMSEDRAIALVDLIIIRPRRYKAVTLGRLLKSHAGRGGRHRRPDDPADRQDRQGPARGPQAQGSDMARGTASGEPLGAPSGAPSFARAKAMGTSWRLEGNLLPEKA